MNAFGVGERILGDDAVSKMIEDLNGRETLGGFNQNPNRELFKGF